MRRYLLPAGAWLTILLLTIALVIQPSPTLAADTTTASNNAYMWLKARVLSTGLVDSYEDQQDICYTYDQAVAAIAFLIKDDQANATKVLDALQRMQHADGSWNTAYVCTTQAVQETQQHVGPVVWVALAVAQYEQRTGDTTTYRAMAQAAITWSLQFQQADGGLNGGLDDRGREISWASTEHNEDAYAALHYFGYQNAAADVKRFLDDVVWDSAHQRWYGGRADPRQPLDVNPWGVSALGPTGHHDYQRALDYAVDHHRNLQPFRSQSKDITVDAFDFDSNKDDIWLEGTAQMVVAFQLVGRTSDAEYFVQEIIKTQQSNGGIPYSLKGTHNGYWKMSTDAAVSSTAWLMFAIENVNPFQPQMPAAITEVIPPPSGLALALDLSELVTTGLLFFALVFAVAVVLVITQNLAWPESKHGGWAALVGVNVGAATVLWFATRFSVEIVALVALSLIVLLLAASLLRNLTAAGRLLIVSHTLLMLFAVVWVGWFIATMPVSPATRGLLFVGYALLVITLPTMLIHAFERWEVVCRTGWSRPHLPLPPASRTFYPKVSFHVACYAEPPEVVIATLNALARVRYPNFEVLLIDNNTPDPSLWQPVEAHCRALGSRFRFFHLHRWYGAKSGALNFALQQTAPDAELVALIDSDYQPEPHFLEAVVGYFDDPKMGFVQTPHDYREWEHSRYLRMCYWEYKFGHLSFASLNERDAAVIVGTMCVIRRKALQEVGGWAEWCITEDSESSIRIHAAGYSSIYLTTTLGRGLIPETFSGYKKQRFRWAYGPIQELKHHLRLYLPRPLGVSSGLSMMQKLHHLNHGLEVVNSGLGFLLIPLGAAIAISMLLHRDAMEVPLAVGVAALVLPGARFALRWLIHRAVMRCSFKDMLGGLLASTALSHTISRAALWGIFTRSIPWRRTSKFKALPTGLEALLSARSELLLGLVLVLFGTGAAAVSGARGLLLFLLMGMVVKGVSYFAAPVLAVFAERDLRSGQAAASDASAEATIAEPLATGKAAVVNQETNQA